MGTQPEPRPHAAIALVAWLLLCFAVGVDLFDFHSSSLPTWYAALVKPPLNPPNWLFGPVWTLLYTLMAIAAWIVWKTRPSPCRRRGCVLLRATRPEFSLELDIL